MQLQASVTRPLRSRGFAQSPPPEETVFMSCRRFRGHEDAGSHAPRAYMEIRRSDPARLPALGRVPVSLMVLPTRFRDLWPLLALAPSHIWRQPVDTSLCGRHRQIPGILSIAQERPSRAFHAVGQRDRANIFGFRASIRARQEPSGAPLPAVHRTTATAPTISSLRMSR